MTETARRGLTTYDVPPDAREPRVPRGLVGFTGEWRTALLPARLLLRAPWLAGAPRGDGRPTILLPGWRAPELSMAPLGLYLRGLGHDTRGWGLGVNQGNPQRDVALMTAAVDALHASTGREVALVGWSLGGLVARETARARPGSVSQVVTFGTPVVGGPTYTIGAGAYGEAQSRRIRERAEALDRADPIRVPVTAMFTRRDNVVDWPACLDRTTPGARHVEVRSTHLGLGLDPDVWLTVAGALATRR